MKISKENLIALFFFVIFSPFVAYKILTKEGRKFPISTPKDLDKKNKSW